jgi:aryl-alcohol dehydrogenase-like predicted oxidoreductase
LYAIKRPTSENVADPPITRVDPNVPIEDTVGAIAETVKAGYVCYMGFLRSARRRSAGRPRAPLADLQIEYSLISCGFHPAGVPQSLP